MRNLTLPAVYLALLLIVVALFRPLLPVDETRYMTVAWEMFLKNDPILLTLNFSPYHHKPPMLFWLINASWHLFGVSRASALIPIFIASLLVVILSMNLARRLFPEEHKINEIMPWVILGSPLFLIYGTMVMFDMMIAAILLGILILFFDHSRDPRWWRLVGAGVLMGLGILTKGPVIYLYALWPLFLYPFWRDARQTLSAPRFMASVASAVCVSAAVAAVWLVPVLLRSDHNFAFWLLWNQTAGRVSGNFSSAHVRPLYFYLMVLPLFTLPWIFLPGVIKSLKTLQVNCPQIRFLLAATIPAIASFSLIAGKQPHYLLPLLPFAMIMIAVLIRNGNYHGRHVRYIACGMLVLSLIANVAGGATVLKRYDLAEFASIYEANRKADWAFVRNYQGEMGFLARVDKPIQGIELGDLPAWFRKHPNGFALVRYDDSNKMKNYKNVYSAAYRQKKLGVFRARPEGSG